MSDRRNPILPDTSDVVSDLLGKPRRPTGGRTREWDKKRSKDTLDLPEELIKEYRDLTAELKRKNPKAKITKNHVVRWLIERGLEEVRSGREAPEPQPTEQYRLFGE